MKNTPAQTNNFAHIWSQVKALTWANIKSRYRKTWAGFLWVVLNPLLMYFVQSQVFSRFLRIPIPNYLLFLASGLLPWILIHQSIDMGTPSFVSSSTLLKAFPTNPMVYLTAQLFDNFVNFLAAFLLILVPLCIKYNVPLIGILFLPIPLFLLCVGITGIVWVLATMQVFFRDTRFIMSFVMSISYFVTPIFYPIESVPENLRWIIKINPFYIFIAPFRVCVYDFSFHEFMLRIVPAFVTASIAITVALYVWERRKNEVYFYL